METLFCNKCYKCPQVGDVYYVTTCSHLFCQTCLNTNMNKNVLSGFENQKCLYCNEEEITYTQIKKLMEEDMGVEFLSESKIIRDGFQLDDLSDATIFQMNQMKSLIKLTQKYDDKYKEVANEFSRNKRQLDNLKKSKAKKIASMRELKEKIIRVREENKRLEAKYGVGNNELESHQLSQLNSTQLLSSQNDISNLQVPLDLQKFIDEMEEKGKSYTVEEKSDTFNTSQIDCDLNKSFFDTSNIDDSELF